MLYQIFITDMNIYIKYVELNLRKCFGLEKLMILLDYATLLCRQHPLPYALSHGIIQLLSNMRLEDWRPRS